MPKQFIIWTFQIYLSICQLVLSCGCIHFLFSTYDSNINIYKGLCKSSFTMKWWLLWTALKLLSSWMEWVRNNPEVPEGPWKQTHLWVKRWQARHLVSICLMPLTSPLGDTWGKAMGNVCVSSFLITVTKSHDQEQLKKAKLMLLSSRVLMVSVWQKACLSIETGIESWLITLLSIFKRQNIEQQVGWAYKIPKSTPATYCL